VQDRDCDLQFKPEEATDRSRAREERPDLVKHSWESYDDAKWQRGAVAPHEWGALAPVSAAPTCRISDPRSSAVGCEPAPQRQAGTSAGPAAALR